MKMNRKMLSFAALLLLLVGRRATNGQSVCSLPSINQNHFESVCASSLRRRFICLPVNAQHTLSVTLWDQLEETIAGQFAFCRYDSLLLQAMPEPIGDRQLVRKWIQMEHVRRQQLRSAGHRNLIQSRTESKPIALDLRPLDKRPTFGLTILDKYSEGDLSSRKCHLAIPRSIYTNRSQLTNFLADVTRHKWSQSYCETDIAVLVLARVQFRGEINGQMIASISLSPRFKLLIEPNATRLFQKLNGKYNHFSQLVPMLFDLLTNLVKLVKTEYQMKDNHIKHSIPTWAMIALVGSGTASILLAILGNYVARQSSVRKSMVVKGGRRTNTRSWKAGFSGGMWAAA